MVAAAGVVSCWMEQILYNNVLKRKTVHNKSVLTFKRKSKPSIQKIEEEWKKGTETAEQLRIGFTCLNGKCGESITTITATKTQESFGECSVHCTIHIEMEKPEIARLVKRMNWAECLGWEGPSGLENRIGGLNWHKFMMHIKYG